MKKIYLLVLIGMNSLFSNAQYTLTLGSMYVSGDIFSSAIPCTNTLVPLGSSGTNQTWNYLSLNPIWVTSQNYTCIAMASVPNATLFPTGTLGQSSAVGTADVYENSTASSKYLGYAMPTSSNSIAYFDTYTNFIFPFTYGTSFSDSYGYISAGTTTTGTINVSGDGTGLLLLPGMSHPNVLKVRTVSTETYVLGGNTYTNINIEDDFYNNSNKSPLLSVWSSTSTSTSMTNTLVNSGANINPNSYASVNELQKNSATKISPNPNNGTFKLQFDNEILNGEIIIYNSLGQKVHEQKISQGENTIVTNGLSRGLYHYSLLQNSQQINTGKIAIE